ncbi:hypothetical protein D7M15_11650 [Streptomyces sp. Z26]|nr:hypothetical protein D7M15_11650 [Streptomyces sp. Z26]
MDPATLLDSKRKQDTYRRIESQLKRFGESHRVPASTLLKLADAVGVNAVDLYGEETLEKAVAAEVGGHIDARALLRAVKARASRTDERPPVRAPQRHVSTRRRAHGGHVRTRHHGSSREGGGRWRPR